MNAGLIAALMMNNTRSRQRNGFNIHDDYDVHEKNDTEASILLLQGEKESMQISGTETIKTV